MQTEDTNNQSSSRGDIQLRRYAKAPITKRNNKHIILNPQTNQPFFTFPTNNVKVPIRAKVLWDILVQKIAKNGQNLDEQMFIDAVILWDKNRFSVTQKHLEPLTIQNGMKETVDSLLLLGYTRMQIGSTELHKFFLTEFKRWIKIDKIQNNANLIPKLYPIIDPLLLNWTISLLAGVEYKWDDPKVLPIAEIPKAIHVAAALVVLQLFSFLRAKELYFTSFSQAQRCITEKVLKIKTKTAIVEVPALVSYTNIKFHKTDYRGKLKTSAFVIATAEQKVSKKSKKITRGPWFLTLMGKAIAVLQAQGRKVVKGKIEWDSIVPPVKVKDQLRPLCRKEINANLKLLEMTTGIKSGTTSYGVRRMSFALAAFNQVSKNLIQKCATWSDNKLLSLYCGENPLGAANKLVKVDRQIVHELLLHIEAKDIYKNIAPVENHIPDNFTQNILGNNYDSDQDSDSDENDLKNNILKFTRNKTN